MIYTHAELKPPITTIILDFGGVLGLPQDPVRAATMASLCRLPPREFSRLYVRDRLEFDRGTLTTDAYWRRLLAAAGVEPTPELIARIENEDSLGWTRVNPRVVAWAAELRRAGLRTAILSNMPTDKLAFMRARPDFDWMGEFDVAIFSCTYSLVKPEEAIYRLCLEQLGCAPGECLFLDDSPVNVEGARAVGIQAILFRSADEAAPILSQTWGLPVRSLVNGTHA